MNPNSALYWLHLIQGVGNIPRTEVVPFDFDDLLRIFDDAEPQKFTINGIWEAAQHVGLPAFVRTDLASAKHNGPNSYVIKEQEDCWRVVYQTLEDNLMKNLKPAAFLVREFLPLQSSFSAFGGHPIAVEWRYFTTKDRVLCRHFYWPKASIRFFGPYMAKSSDWTKQLSKMRGTRPTKEIDSWVMQAAARCPACEQWSVDFALDTSGKWWLIDMAKAEDSWHPKHR